jgi:hypothetical protein
MFQRGPGDPGHARSRDPRFEIARGLEAQRIYLEPTTMNYSNSHTVYVDTVNCRSWSLYFFYSLLIDTLPYASCSQ